MTNKIKKIKGNEDQTPHYLLLYLKGKTNQFGRLEISGAIRYKEVCICLLGHLVAYFFWRWYIEAELFPSFATSKDWYNIKLLKVNSKDLTASLSHRAHYNAIVKVLKALGMNTKAKTH